MRSNYYEKSVELGKQFQLDHKSWAGYDVIKYKNQIHDLVTKFEAKTILDYGCGKGLQYIDLLPYHSEDVLQTFDQYLNVEVYKYDPCVEQFKETPPKGTKFDGVICTQVLGSIPDQDLPWVAQSLKSYTNKFCFVGLNFQKPGKKSKMIYDSEFYKLPRTRQFFKSFFNDWNQNNLFWWWKDRVYYKNWLDDQLNGNWKDIPDNWTDKYTFVETIYD